MLARKRFSTISLPPALVADANVILSALIGGRARLVLAEPRAPRCCAAEWVAEEVLEHLPALARRRGLDLALLLATFAVLPIEWRSPDSYERCRRDAQRLIADRDPDDWPTVALALATSHPVWTQDKDFAVTGITTWTTGALLDMLDTSSPSS